MAIKTKNLIIESFYNLLENDNIEQITVTDLVESCNISRQTFYYHFKDIPTMIAWIFEHQNNQVTARLYSANNAVEIMDAIAKFVESISPILKASFNTASFINIYNLLTKEMKAIVDISLVNYYQLTGQHKEAISVFWTNSLTGLAISEAQKQNQDYYTIFKSVAPYIPKKQ